MSRFPQPRIITLFAVLVLSFLAPLAFGAESVRELAPGVVYVRAASLPAHPPAAARTRIVDLRGAGADVPPVSALAAWLPSDNDTAVSLVLLDAGTAPALRGRLPVRRPRLLTVASRASGVPANVQVRTTPEREQAAVQALAGGRDPLELLEAKSEKRRYDEASMVRDHAAGVPIPDAPPDDAENPQDTGPPSSPSTEGSAPAAPVSARLVDEVLQRALHLHQALTASARHAP